MLRHVDGIFPSPVRQAFLDRPHDLDRHAIDAQLAEMGTDRLGGREPDLSNDVIREAALDLVRARFVGLDVDVMERLVYDSVLMKSSIVNHDERERGERRKLNLGHTFGHALEKVSGIPHGEAVSVGTMLAAIIWSSMFAPAVLRRKNVFRGNTPWMTAAVSLS